MKVVHDIEQMRKTITGRLHGFEPPIRFMEVGDQVQWYPMPPSYLDLDFAEQELKVLAMMLGAQIYPDHDLQHDPTGTGRDRWSCFAKRPGCDGRAVIRQPYMTEAVWERELANFKQAHGNPRPCDFANANFMTGHWYCDKPECPVHGGKS